MLEWLPEGFTSWVSIITIAAFGILAALNIIDRVARKKRGEATDIETRVVKGLKDELDLYTKRMNRQDLKMEEMERKLIQLEAENKTLRELLSGRDEQSMEYRKRGLATMELVEQMAKGVDENGRSIKNLYEAINKHLEKEGQIVEHMA